jgi:hypothetical protein
MTIPELRSRLIGFPHAVASLIRSIPERLWNTNPLALLAGIVFAHIVAFQLGWLPLPLILTMILVMELGYLQNTTYTMQSRGATRNHNGYHAIGAVLASFTFFASLRVLVLHDLPLVLLAPYMFMTVLGTLHGVRVCIRIEKFFHIYVGDKVKGAVDIRKLMPSIAALCVLLIGQVAYLSWRGGVLVHISEKQTLVLGAGTLVLLVALQALGGFTFAFLRTSRNTDSYWLHAIAVIVNLTVEFIELMVLVKFRLNWSLFLPVTTGNVIGSLLGANTAQLAMGWTTATFGIHEYTKDEMKQREATGLIHWPTMQLACMAPLVVLQAGVIFTGFAALGTSLLIFTLTGWRELSFTMKSRAGNRDNERYLNWTSVFSNGVWYIALAPLALNGIHWDKALPYVAGAGMGSLIGQLVSMRAERILDARMDAHDSVVQSDARTVTA